MTPNIAFTPHGIQQIDGQTGNSAHAAPVMARKLLFKAAAFLMAILLVMACVPSLLVCQHQIRRVRRLSFKHVNTSTQHESGIVSELTNLSQQGYFFEQVLSKPANASNHTIFGTVSDFWNLSEQRQALQFRVWRLHVCNHGNVAVKLALIQKPQHATSLIVGPWVARRSCHYFDPHQMARQWLDDLEIRCLFMRAGESHVYPCIGHEVYYKRSAIDLGGYYCSILPSGSSTICHGPVLG